MFILVKGDRMRNIRIKRFGAVGDVSIDIDKSMQVLIGEQASGKSTICKTIYYCLKIRDYTLDYLMDKEQFTNNSSDEYFNNYMRYLQKKFMGCFGKTRHMSRFEIRYEFNNGEILIKQNRDGFVHFTYSADLKNRIQFLINDADKMYHRGVSENISSVFDQMQTLAIMKNHFQDNLRQIFNCASEIVYIPAGRSLLASMSEQLDFSISDMDLTMQEFIALIRKTKSSFGSKIPDIKEEYLKTVKGKIDEEALNSAYDLIRKILKADYICDNEGEKIYFDKNHWVKLMYGSSGQQEILWILLLAYVFILEKRRTFFIIEEPEAHLFPKAQKYVIELIALMSNVTQSNTIITTHSPYILTSLNILLFSHKVEGEQRNCEIIPYNRRLDYSRFGAFMVDGSKRDGNMVDLLDDETNMIDTEYIDSVSSICNEELNSLIDKEIADDMQ